MCLGSLLLPRMVSARHHPLRVYAALELGIGIIGLLLLWGMPLISGVYTAWAGSGTGGLIVRGLIAAFCLLPPTLLMGATLPAVARWVETTPTGRVVARIFLRRQHRRCRDRLPRRRFLSPARLRYVDRDVCRGRAEPARRLAGRRSWRGRRRRPRPGTRPRPGATSSRRPAPGRSTSRSGCPA